MSVDEEQRPDPRRRLRGPRAGTILSAAGDEAGVTLIDSDDSFVFGFSKLDVMFGRKTSEAVRLPYRDIDKPGVRFPQETVTAIDPRPGA